MHHCILRGHRDAGDSLQVGEEVDAGEVSFVEELLDHGLLALADLQQQVAPGNQRRGGGRDEAAVEGEAVGAGEERGMRFEADDLGRERLVISNVGQVGDDEVEVLAFERLQQVGLKKADAPGDAVGLGVLLGDSEGGRGRYLSP